MLMICLLYTVPLLQVLTDRGIHVDYRYEHYHHYYDQCYDNSTNNNNKHAHASVTK
jgi:hypothetical protein